MRVATRLSLSLGSLVAIVLVVLLVHVRTLRSVVSTGYTLSEISGRVTLSSRTQLARLEQIEENASKYVVTRDRDYLERMRTLEREFAADLAALARLPLTPGERGEADGLRRLWRSYEAVARSFAASGEEERPAEIQRLRRLRSELLELDEQVRRVGEASQGAMDAALARSASIARRAEWISWGAVGAGLVLSIVLSAMTVRSISGALRRLRRGTREVASGNFAYRIATDRSDEFAEVARDFNGMSHRLGELDRMKRDFVSNVSHDLKTPLASMQEITRALLDEVPGPLTADQARLLDLHLQSGQRLAAMITNLLDLSAMEAGAVELRRARHALGGLVHQALQAVEPARAMGGVAISTDLPDEPVALGCDGPRVQQLLVNLLDNAIKYTPAGGRVVVEGGVHRQRPTHVPEERWRGAWRRSSDGEAVLVAIIDSGPGIPPADRERVFERFVQSEPGGGRRRGVGLGLAICREIVDAHGGSVWAGASAEGGCAMYVLLPHTFAHPAVDAPVERELAPS